MKPKYEVIGQIPGVCPDCGKLFKALVVVNPVKGKGFKKCTRCFNTWKARQM